MNLCIICAYTWSFEIFQSHSVFREFSCNYHSPHFDWDLSIGNSSMVMSLVFLVDKFTIFSWIWRISFTCYKGITIVDIFSPCECSLQLLYIRRRQKEVCRTCTTSQNKSHQNYLIINLSMIVIQVWIYIYLKRRFVI